MKVVYADSVYSAVWWGARAAFAEWSTGFMEATKAKPGRQLLIESQAPCGAQYIWTNFTIF
jgi:hypothetical protein